MAKVPIRVKIGLDLRLAHSVVALQAKGCCCKGLTDEMHGIGCRLGAKGLFHRPFAPRRLLTALSAMFFIEITICQEKCQRVGGLGGEGLWALRYLGKDRSDLVFSIVVR